MNKRLYPYPYPLSYPYPSRKTGEEGACTTGVYRVDPAGRQEEKEHAHLVHTEQT